MSVTPDDVKALTKPTAGFLCPLSANIYGLEFMNFTISDYESKKVIFEVGKDNPASQDVSLDFSAVGEDMYRKIKYRFSEDVLRLPYIQTSLVFSVGNREVRDFRMIERHYFRDQLVKSFDFQFGFCIPGSVNTWDTVYSLPPMSEDLINEMINHPYETKSDSFYFVDGQIVMHNKASYEYLREDAAQAKKSYEDKYGAKGAKTGAKAPASKKDGPDLDSDMYMDTTTGVTAGVEGLSVADGMSTDDLAGMAGADSKEAKEAAALGAKSAKEQVWSKESDYF